VNRDTAVILALGALAVAAVVVSIGSFVLLWSDRRDRRLARSKGNPGPDRSGLEASPPAES
jgi:hypothetical protein